MPPTMPMTTLLAKELSIFLRLCRAIIKAVKRISKKLENPKIPVSPKSLK